MNYKPVVSRRALPLIALLISTSSLSAQTPVAENSAPSATPIVNTVPQARDIPWPGEAIRLDIDATNIGQRIVQVKETIPVAVSGPLTLLLPEWLPGNHSPRGEIDKLVGLRFYADGKEIRWTRDPVNVFAFHINIPDGAKAIVAAFQYVSATEADQGRIKFTDAMMNLQWENLSLYPAGYYVRRVPFQANVTYPAGWSDATALRGTRSGATVAYNAVPYDVLIDSPIFAGAHEKSFDLGHQVTLNVFADNPAELVATPDQITAHKKLVDEALNLFGAHHFDHYDFLFAISNDLGGIGLEHHRSSENALKNGYFTKWNEGPGGRNLLPHEFTHSWDGKFRRGADLWTPDYAQPMRNSLLWVYEGQTQFWGYVLGARSGIYSKDQTLDALAAIAARLDATNGRQWRSVEDTTNDPITASRKPKPWSDWARGEDYYNEGLMVWLEADGIIRQGTNGAKGMDDFAKAFFGVRNGDWGELTYTRADVVDTLNGVFPYDWDSFLRTRIDEPTKEVTKGGFALGGYKLVYGKEANGAIKDRETSGKFVDQSYGTGLIVKEDGAVSSVVWNSPAFKAGMTIADKIIAVNGLEYNKENFLAAIDATASAKKPMELIVKQGHKFTTIKLDYSGGIRYPRLQKIGETEGSLDRLLKPQT